jgi:small subunit ribosomal protein S27e
MHDTYHWGWRLKSSKAEENDERRKQSASLWWSLHLLKGSLPDNCRQQRKIFVAPVCCSSFSDTCLFEHRLRMASIEVFSSQPSIPLLTHCSFLLQQFRQTYKQTNIKMPADLLNPTPELEARTHKLKRLVQSPNSFFMDIKCPGCFQITTVFSHAQSVVLCGNCNSMLCQPTGGRARLTEGCSYRKKVD